MNLLEAKVSYKEITTNGKRKTVKFTSLVEVTGDFSYGDVQETLMKQYGGLDELAIESIKVVKILPCDVFKGDSLTWDAEGDYKWWKATVAMIDGETGKTHKVQMLAKATSIANALKVLKNGVGESSADWEETAVVQTKIYEVILK